MMGCGSGESNALTPIADQVTDTDQIFSIEDSGFFDKIQNHFAVNLESESVSEDRTDDIISGETFWKKESAESKYIRTRKIPVKKTKKYPTKKKNEIDIERKKCRFDKYNMMNNYGN